MCIRDSIYILPTRAGFTFAGTLLVMLLAAINYQLNLGYACLLYTSDAADERSSVDLGGRRIIKKQDNPTHQTSTTT